MQIGNGVVQMECIDYDFDAFPVAGFVDVILQAQQFRLYVAVLTGQIAIQIRRDGGAHHLDGSVTRKAEIRDLHTT